jgi:riboflavin synthase
MQSLRGALRACDGPLLDKCYGLRVFTGLIEAVGHIQARTERALGQQLLIKSDLGDWVLGESVSVNGVCLTVSNAQAGGFYVDVSAETLDKSSLGRLAVGSAVNLERALRLGDRLGGHWVSGHVDAVIQLLSAMHVGEAIHMAFELPHDLARYVAPKGSVAVEGVSLTVNEVQADRFSVMIVPHTRQATTLDRARPGDSLNLEVDIIARYVVHTVTQAPTSILPEALRLSRDESLHQALVQSGFIHDSK